MVKPRKDLTNMKFGKLTVICQSDDYVNPNGIHSSQWLCECSCEQHTQIIVSVGNLTSGHTKSCGCLKSNNNQYLKKANKKDLSGEYGIIWATNTNEKIYFDLEDANEILKYCWYIDASGYPSTCIHREKIRMHVLLGFKRYDHHNRNKLDNRKENLIFCSNQENIRNSSIKKNNTSGITGVYFDKTKNKWVAQITIDYKTKRIGGFDDKDDAIYARLKAEKEYFNEFAPQKHLFEQYNIN